MDTQRFRVFDPLAGELAMPVPSAQSFTKDEALAALFDSEAAAIIHAENLISQSRPWLVMQPVCPICGGSIEP